VFDKTGFKKFVTDVSPLLTILFGVALIAFTLGPYNTYDTQLEFEAASNVVSMGIPYVEGFGTVIDQPPLGFYTEALFFRIFGLSLNTGVALVTLFGLGSTVLMYLLGKELYSKSAGILAAALFGLNPWQLVLSRSFLIDTQCLFFSILCLLTGIWAIRKGSVKLSLISGVVFAAALLTKFYAAFVLIPLLLFYLYSRPKKPKLVLSQLAAFLLPTLLFAVFWYQIVLGRSVSSIFLHNDFADVVPTSTGVVASPFFVSNFMLNYGLGLSLVVAISFALILGFSLRKYFPKVVVVDLVCLVTVAIVLTVNVYLGAILNLNVPYFSAIKYGYQALPFFVLIAASLSAKSLAISETAKLKTTPKKLLLWLVAVVSMVLLAASIISAMYTINVISTRDYLQYRVEPQVDYGYALSTVTPLTAGSPLMTVQYLGLALVLCGLLFGLFWGNKNKLMLLPKHENA
jgi:4-amino-4-deoxy-L-arabinose transferase-like glycosyltransferase